MRKSRIYVQRALTANTEIEISNSTAHYIARVLRLRPTDTLQLFDGQGNEFQARIKKSKKDSVCVQVLEQLAREDAPPIQITLLQALAKGERMDWALQKATELGVFAIQPIETKRTVVRLDEDKKDKRLSHWRKVVISACEQSGRSRLPDVRRPMAFAAALEILEAHTKVLLHPNAKTRFQDLESPKHSVALLIGPEGGFDDNEIHLAKSLGFVDVCLGPRILRSETAPLAALAVIQSLWGDL